MEAVVQPRYRKPRHGNESALELRVDPCDYDTFRDKCLQLPIAEHLVVIAVVNHILSFMLAIGDLTETDRKRENLRRALEFFETQKAGGAPADGVDSAIATAREALSGMDERTRANYQAYCRLCEQLLPPLLSEQIDLPKLANELESDMLDV